MSGTPSERDGFEPEITRFFAGLDDGARVPDVDGAMRALGVRIDSNDLPVPVARNRHYGRWIAAAVAAIVAIVFLVKPHTFNTTMTGPTYSYRTNSGQTATFHIDDGSKVILAPATTIRVTDRNVELHGEAVFTVTKHRSDPFTVKTGTTVTRVLGTTFGVRAYDQNVQVAVQDGKVSVDTSYVLSAGDVATVESGKVQVKRNTNVKQLLSWTAGSLRYQGALLKDIVPDLNRWYGVEIRILDHQLAAQRFTGTLKPGSVAELANILELTYKVRVTRVGNVLTLDTFSSQ